MAITPQEAARITQKETEALKRAEQELDGLLKQRYRGRPVRIDVTVNRLTERCRDELIRRYRAAGWDVERKSGPSDPRELSGAPYWLFKASAPINVGFASQIANPAPPPWQES